MARLSGDAFNATVKRDPRGRWLRKLSASSLARQRREERADAAKFLTGEKVRRWESPKMIALHGRAPWPPKAAHEDRLKSLIRARLVTDRHPSGALQRARARKVAKVDFDRLPTSGRGLTRLANRAGRRS